jgi:hypothetical protein
MTFVRNPKRGHPPPWILIQVIVRGTGGSYFYTKAWRRGLKSINPKSEGMKNFILGLLILGLTSPIMAQVIKTEELSEVVLYATNYKYLNSVASEEPAAIPVEMLERKVAAFNLEDSDYYQDDYDFYQIRFFIPDGKILAAYDKDGKILRTIEKFKNVKLPESVSNAVLDRFPGWTVSEDTYLVNYHQTKGVEKSYKLTLVNGDKKIRVKLDDKGNFL